MKLTKLNQTDFQRRQHLSLGIPTLPKNKTLHQLINLVKMHVTNTVFN